MKKYLILTSLVSSFAWAHQPYVAPNSYFTENTQIPVIAGYAEDALHSEYALKDVVFNITNPAQKSTSIQPQSTLSTATVFDLPLAEDGTYQIVAKVTYPLQYVLYDKQWKIFYDSTAEKAGALKDRDYVIPADFKQNKVPALTHVNREWSIQSYVSKKKTTPIAQISGSNLNVSFSVHPNEIKPNMPVILSVKRNNQVLKNAQISILTQGQAEDAAIKTVSDAQGSAELKFPQSGEYLITVHEKLDSQKKPQNELYTITTLYVHP